MKISFQGESGAYSDLACRQIYPNAQTIGCLSFDDAFTMVQSGESDLAFIPIDNTLAGRVADVHHLLPQSNLHIIGEHFLPIDHCLLAVKGSKLSDITHVSSHVHAIPQCREFIRNHQLASITHADTAGAAADIAQKNDPCHGAIASSLTAEIYGLDILARGIQDDASNKTRFIILSKSPAVVDANDDLMTSFTFTVRDIPAALYKALGGFATNQVNMMKLESYVDSQFNAARFYCEVEGHPREENLCQAMEELGFFAKEIKILGSYPKSKLRDGF